MNPSTNDYLLRLYAWASLALFLQGVALVLSWIGHERVLGNARPRLRYRLLCLHFAGFLLVPFVTVGVIHLLTSASLIGGDIPGTDTGISHSAPSQPIILLAHLLFTHASVILSVWACGALLSGIDFTREWRRISRDQYFPASPHLIQQVAILSTELDLDFSPTVMQGEIEIPHVIGFRKPAVV